MHKGSFLHDKNRTYIRFFIDKNKRLRYTYLTNKKIPSTQAALAYHRGRDLHNKHG